MSLWAQYIHTDSWIMYRVLSANSDTIPAWWFIGKRVPEKCFLCIQKG